MIWVTNNHNALGLLPDMLSTHDERPAKEQFNANYTHGGGWQPFNEFVLRDLNFRRPTEAIICYPGDPPYSVVGYTELRDELILVFPYAWVAIVQLDGSYEIARMD